MLGIGCSRPSSYPVGYADYLTLQGLDFEESLWAQGLGRDLTSMVRQQFEAREPVGRSALRTRSPLLASA